VAQIVLVYFRLWRKLNIVPREHSAAWPCYYRVYRTAKWHTYYSLNIL